MGAALRTRAVRRHVKHALLATALLAPLGPARGSPGLHGALQENAGDPEATQDATGGAHRPDATPAPRADRFVGTFADGRLTVMLTGMPGRYVGALGIADRLFALEAIAGADGGIAGTFDVAGQRFEFAAAFEGEVLVLRSGEARFELRRLPPWRGRGNPLTEPGRPPAPAAPKEGFALVRHPTGFSLQHPVGWKVVETADAMQLIPPDVKQEAWGPAEVFMVSGEKADDVRTPTDPRVQQYLAGLLAQTLGVELRAEGGIEAAQLGPHEAAILTWRGELPEAGGRFRARAFVVLIEGYGVTLACVGPPLRIKRRDSVLREIVSTFALDPTPAAAQEIEPGAPVDERLVGRWYRSVYRRSALPDGIDTSFHQTMILAPDGTLSWVNQTLITGEQRPGAVSSGWTFSGIPESQVQRGRWTVSGDRVRVTWKGGGATYSVYLQGSPGRREMLLTPLGGGEKELWTEYANN